MNNNDIQWLVVTDLDGTLLNHHNYATGDVSQTIQRLKEKNIPVIFNTSKTYAETRRLQLELGVDNPFIVENGSCIYLPKQQFPEKPVDASERDSFWQITTGQTHEKIDQILAAIDTPQTCYVRLSRCTAQEASALTGLTLEHAKQAIAREYSEPLIWQADDRLLNKFTEQLESHHLKTLQGGRFLHVLGLCDKGVATNNLAECYGNNIKVIALGDSPNDRDMLAMADISAIVHSPSSQQLELLITPDINTVASAPEGWTEAINKALKMISTGAEYE